MNTNLTPYDSGERAEPSTWTPSNSHLYSLPAGDRARIPPPGRPRGPPPSASARSPAPLREPAPQPPPMGGELFPPAVKIAQAGGRGRGGEKSTKYPFGAGEDFI